MSHMMGCTHCVACCMKRQSQQSAVEPATVCVKSHCAYFCGMTALEAVTWPACLFEAPKPLLVLCSSFAVEFTENNRVEKRSQTRNMPAGAGRGAGLMPVTPGVIKTKLELEASNAIAGVSFGLFLMSVMPLTSAGCGRKHTSWMHCTKMH